MPLLLLPLPSLFGAARVRSHALKPFSNLNIVKLNLIWAMARCSNARDADDSPNDSLWVYSGRRRQRRQQIWYHKRYDTLCCAMSNAWAAVCVYGPYGSSVGRGIRSQSFIGRISVLFVSPPTICSGWKVYWIHTKQMRTGWMYLVATAIAAAGKNKRLHIE